MTKNPRRMIRRYQHQPTLLPIADTDASLADISASKESYVIGTTDMIRDYWLSERLHRFSAVCSMVSLEIVTADEPFLAKQLSEGRYDVAFLLGSSTRPSADLMGRLCTNESLQLVQAISPNDPAPTLYDILLFSDHVTYGRSAIQQLIQHGSSALTVKLPTMEAVKQAVLHGFGAALLPHMMVEQELHTGKLQAFPTPDSLPSVPIWACWPQQQRLSPHLDQLMQYLGFS